MPSPSSSLATLRPDLGGSLEEFNLDADRQGFIAHLVLPEFKTAKQAGPFGRIPVEQLLQHPETVRAPGSAYARRKWKFETDAYVCTEHGLEEPVDDAEAEMYADYFDAELVATQRCKDAVLRAREMRAANAIFNSTNYTAHDVTNEWDDWGNATPIRDMETGVQAFYLQCGMWPNAFICNRSVFRNVRQCEEIIDRIKYQGFQDVRASSITAAALAQVWDLEYVIVAGGTKNLTNEAAAAQFGSIWSNEYGMLTRIPTSNDIREPGLGRTFHWTGDGSELDGHVETYRDETVRADIVRVRHQIQEKRFGAEFGYLFGNLTT